VILHEPDVLDQCPGEGGIREQVIDRSVGAFLAGRHEAGVDAQREAGVGVAEVASSSQRPN
jgi:hypothetical protein